MEGLRQQEVPDNEIDTILEKLLTKRMMNNDDMVFMMTSNLVLFHELREQFVRLGQLEEHAICLANTILTIRRQSPPNEPYGKSACSNGLHHCLITQSNTIQQNDQRNSMLN